MSTYDFTEHLTAITEIIGQHMDPVQKEALRHQDAARYVVAFLHALSPDMKMTRTQALEWAAAFVEENKLYAQPTSRGYTEKSDTRPEKDEAVLKFARFAMGEEQ